MCGADVMVRWSGAGGGRADREGVGGHHEARRLGEHHTHTPWQEAAVGCWLTLQCVGLLLQWRGSMNQERLYPPKTSDLYQVGGCWQDDDTTT